MDYSEAEALSVHEMTGPDNGAETHLSRIIDINSDFDPVELRKFANVSEALLIWASAARAVDQPR